MKENEPKLVRISEVHPAADKDLVKEALQLTWLLKGHLKNAQVA